MGHTRANLLKKTGIMALFQLYNKKKGWDQDGIPRDETLKRLGLLSIKSTILKKKRVSIQSVLKN